MHSASVSSIATAAARVLLGGRAGLRRLLLLCALGSAALTLGCPGTEYPKCEKDDQCKKDKAGKAINEYCLFGKCQQCAKDSQCSDGQRCNRGKCEATCVDDASCGDGKICEAASCVEAQCTPVKACGGGMECTAGRCAAPSSTSGTGSTGAVDSSVVCEKAKRTVPFDFNVSDLRPDTREALDNLAKCLQQNAAWRLTVEGHCDERGTTDYNLQLGERRASSVRDYLVRLGVDKARVKTISYGKERPVDPASTEEAWAKNRRSELILQ